MLFFFAYVLQRGAPIIRLFCPLFSSEEAPRIPSNLMVVVYGTLRAIDQNNSISVISCATFLRCCGEN